MIDDTEVLSEPIALTDMGNAERFASQHGGKLKFVQVWGKWFFWNGRYWELDDTGYVYRLAKQTARKINAEAAMFSDVDEQKKVTRWALSSQSRNRLESLIALAKSEEPIPARHNSFDTGTWLLHCSNITYDLSQIFPS